MLRREREKRGEDLRYVAQILRIRYPYLQAIEEGQPDELPGPTYAVGFVRTYADHLGLDSEKLVQQFKDEAAGLQARADLHFPAPLPEGKIPSGVVLVVAVVLAAAVYGAWIYLSSEKEQVAELAPQLPNQITEIIKGKPDAGMSAGGASPDSLAGEKSAASTVVGAVETQAKEEPAAAAGTDAMPKEPANPAAGSGEGEQSAAAATVQAPAEERSESAAQQAASSAIPQPPSDGAEASEADVTPPVSTVMTSPQDGSGQTETVSETANEADRAPPKVYGEENANARIVIHAAADSWVEVRDGVTDELLLTRVLFKGDRYRVPDRSGLTLLTGNAGGLRIVVDGEPIPSIGPLGAVRRNVLLEPSPLKSGSAVRTNGGSPRSEPQTSEQPADSGFQPQ